MAIFEIAWRGMSRKILKILSVIVLNAFAIVLVGAVIFMNDNYNYDRYRSNSILKNGNDETYFILINGEGEFVTEEAFYGIEEIEYINTVYDGGGFEWNEIEELKKQQQEIYKEKGYIIYGGYLNLYELSNMDALNMYNIEFKEKLDIEDINESTVYLYIGSKYKGIEVGTKYNVTDHYDAVVAGIFKENQNIVIDNNLAGSIGDMEEAAVKSLDEQIVAIFPMRESIYPMNAIVTLKAGADYETAKEKIIAAIEKCGSSCVIATVSETLDEKDEANGMFVGILRGIMTIIIFSSILISSCIMILDIQKNQKMYGIMSANGFTTSDIIKAIVLENALIMILSIVAAVFITLTQTNTIFGNDVFIRMTIPKLLIFCIALMIIASVAPAIYISRMDTKKMIQGEAV